MEMNRRSFMTGLAGSAVGSLTGGPFRRPIGFAEAVEANRPDLPELKVTHLDVFPVASRSVFVRLETDSPLVGWGEPTLEGHANTIIAAVKDLGRYLLGKSPWDIERHWQAMYRGDFYRGGPIKTSALSGVDQALWDLLGKALGQPVHQLLGGRARDRIKIYGGMGGNDASQVHDSAQQAFEQGYLAAKMDPTGTSELLEGYDFIKRAYSRVEAARNAVPDHFDVLLDFHGKLSPSMAISVIDAITELRPFFVEEPIRSENVDELARVARAVTVPIAAGERRFTKHDFRPMLEKQAVAVIQPDLCHAGGVTEVKKIAAMAEAYYVGVAPHNPLQALSTAACLQIDSCCPNFIIQERGSLGEGLLKEPFVVKEGYIDVPMGPGMGVEIDEELLRKRREEWVDWVTPYMRAEDGSVVDW